MISRFLLLFGASIADGIHIPHKNDDGLIEPLSLMEVRKVVDEVEVDEKKVATEQETAVAKQSEVNQNIEKQQVTSVVKKQQVPPVAERQQAQLAQHPEFLAEKTIVKQDPHSVDEKQQDVKKTKSFLQEQTSKEESSKNQPSKEQVSEEHPSKEQPSKEQPSKEQPSKEQPKEKPAVPTQPAVVSTPTIAAVAAPAVATPSSTTVSDPTSVSFIHVHEEHGQHHHHHHHKEGDDHQMSGTSQKLGQGKKHHLGQSKEHHKVHHKHKHDHEHEQQQPGALVFAQNKDDVKGLSFTEKKNQNGRRGSHENYQPIAHPLELPIAQAYFQSFLEDPVPVPVDILKIVESLKRGKFGTVREATSGLIMPTYQFRGKVYKGKTSFKMWFDSSLTAKDFIFFEGSLEPEKIEKAIDGGNTGGAYSFLSTTYLEPAKHQSSMLFKAKSQSQIRKNLKDSKFQQIKFTSQAAEINFLKCVIYSDLQTALEVWDYSNKGKADSELWELGYDAQFEWEEQFGVIDDGKGDAPRRVKGGRAAAAIQKSGAEKGVAGGKRSASASLDHANSMIEMGGGATGWTESSMIEMGAEHEADVKTGSVVTSDIGLVATKNTKASTSTPDKTPKASEGKDIVSSDGKDVLSDAKGDSKTDKTDERVIPKPTNSKDGIKTDAVSLIDKKNKQTEMKEEKNHQRRFRPPAKRSKKKGGKGDEDWYQDGDRDDDENEDSYQDGDDDEWDDGGDDGDWSQEGDEDDDNAVARATSKKDRPEPKYNKKGEPIDPWRRYKFGELLLSTWDKFSQNRALADKLMDTDGKILVNLDSVMGVNSYMGIGIPIYDTTANKHDDRPFEYWKDRQKRKQAREKEKKGRDKTELGFLERRKLPSSAFETVVETIAPSSSDQTITINQAVSPALPALATPDVAAFIQMGEEELARGKKAGAKKKDEDDGGAGDGGEYEDEDEEELDENEEEGYEDEDGERPDWYDFDEDDDESGWDQDGATDERLCFTTAKAAKGLFKDKASMSAGKWNAGMSPMEQKKTQEWGPNLLGNALMLVRKALIVKYRQKKAPVKTPEKETPEKETPEKKAPEKKAAPETPKPTIKSESRSSTPVGEKKGSSSCCGGRSPSPSSSSSSSGYTKTTITKSSKKGTGRAKYGTFIQQKGGEKGKGRDNGAGKGKGRKGGKFMQRGATRAQRRNPGGRAGGQGRHDQEGPKSLSDTFKEEAHVPTSLLEKGETLPKQELSNHHTSKVSPSEPSSTLQMKKKRKKKKTGRRKHRHHHKKHKRNKGASTADVTAAPGATIAAPASAPAALQAAAAAPIATANVPHLQQPATAKNNIVVPTTPEDVAVDNHRGSFLEERDVKKSGGVTRGWTSLDRVGMEFLENDSSFMEVHTNNLQKRNREHLNDQIHKKEAVQIPGRRMPGDYHHQDEWLALEEEEKAVNVRADKEAAVEEKAIENAENNENDDENNESSGDDGSNEGEDDEEYEDDDTSGKKNPTNGEKNPTILTRYQNENGEWLTEEWTNDGNWLQDDTGVWIHKVTKETWKEGDDVWVTMIKDSTTGKWKPAEEDIFATDDKLYRRNKEYDEAAAWKTSDGTTTWKTKNGVWKTHDGSRTWRKDKDGVWKDQEGNVWSENDPENLWDDDAIDGIWNLAPTTTAPSTDNKLKKKATSKTTKRVKTEKKATTPTKSEKMKAAPNKKEDETSNDEAAKLEKLVTDLKDEQRRLKKAQQEDEQMVKTLKKEEAKLKQTHKEGDPKKHTIDAKTLHDKEIEEEEGGKKKDEKKDELEMEEKRKQEEVKDGTQPRDDELPSWLVPMAKKVGNAMREIPSKAIGMVKKGCNKLNPCPVHSPEAGEDVEKSIPREDSKILGEEEKIGTPITQREPTLEDQLLSVPGIMNSPLTTAKIMKMQDEDAIKDEEAMEESNKELTTGKEKSIKKEDDATKMVAKYATEKKATEGVASFASFLMLLGSSIVVAVVIFLCILWREYKKENGFLFSDPFALNASSKTTLFSNKSKQTTVNNASSTKSTLDDGRNGGSITICDQMNQNGGGGGPCRATSSTINTAIIKSYNRNMNGNITGHYTYDHPRARFQENGVNAAVNVAETEPLMIKGPPAEFLSRFDDSYVGTEFSEDRFVNGPRDLYPVKKPVIKKHYHHEDDHHDEGFDPVFDDPLAGFYDPSNSGFYDPINNVYSTPLGNTPLTPLTTGGHSSLTTPLTPLTPVRHKIVTPSMRNEPATPTTPTVNSSMTPMIMQKSPIKSPIKNSSPLKTGRSPLKSPNKMVVSESSVVSSVVAAGKGLYSPYQAVVSNKIDGDHLLDPSSTTANSAGITTSGANTSSSSASNQSSKDAKNTGKVSVIIAKSKSSPADRKKGKSGSQASSPSNARENSQASQRPETGSVGTTMMTSGQLNSQNSQIPQNTTSSGHGIAVHFHIGSESDSGNEGGGASSVRGSVAGNSWFASDNNSMVRGTDPSMRGSDYQSVTRGSDNQSIRGSDNASLRNSDNNSNAQGSSIRGTQCSSNYGSTYVTQYTQPSSSASSSSSSSCDHPSHDERQGNHPSNLDKTGDHLDRQMARLRELTR